MSNLLPRVRDGAMMELNKVRKYLLIIPMSILKKLFILTIAVFYAPSLSIVIAGSLIL